MCPTCVTIIISQTWINKQSRYKDKRWNHDNISGRGSVE